MIGKIYGLKFRKIMGHRLLRYSVMCLVMLALVAGLILPSSQGGSSVQAQSGGATAPFVALEIAVQEPLEIPAPLFSNPKRNDIAMPTGLPPGSIVLFVVSGVVRNIKSDATGQEWEIGSPPVFVYPYSGTRLDNIPQVGDLVKAIGLRTVAPGPITAGRIIMRQKGPQPLAAPVADLAFLFNGLVSAANPHLWTIGGVNFAVDDTAAPAQIDLGLGKGSAVTVEFGVAAAAPAPAPPPGQGVPPPGGAAGTFVALEIAVQEPLDIHAPLYPGPRPNKIAVPAGLPPGSIVLFTITGVVKEIRVKRAGGEEWQIGNPPVFVYPSASTRIVNGPIIGDLVKIVALRTLAEGPLVAEKITLRGRGPLALAVPTIEMAFLFNGAVSSANPNIWTVGGVNFIINDPAAPADIDPGLGSGSAVTVEFNTAAAPVAGSSLPSLPLQPPAPAPASASASGQGSSGPGSGTASTPGQASGGSSGGANTSGGNTGGAAGGTAAGTSGGSTGSATGSPGGSGAAGGSTSGAAAGSSGGSTGGSAGGSGGSSGGTSGGSTGGSAGGSSGGSGGSGGK